MRHYPHNSPQAIARIAALGMLIDGVAERAEHALIEQDDTLQLDQQRVEKAIQALYEDLDLGGSMTRPLDHRLSTGDISRMLGEVTSPLLQQRLLRLLMRISVANDELSPGEARLIRAALIQWGDDEAAGISSVQSHQSRARVGEREISVC